jgi:hypothetical protein
MRDFRLDFCGIGVAKAGTSWIAQCLAEHPSLCVAQGKETNFFLSEHFCAGLWARPAYYTTARHGRSIEWYKEKFSRHRPGQLYGEYSTAYIADPRCPELLHAHNPEMKLLCSFRNPTDAAYAGYYELSVYQPLPESFEEALVRYPQLLEYGRYRRNLEPFLERFPRERIHLMLFDDIAADPSAFFRRICEFLEIDPSFSPRSVTERVRPRMVLRSLWLRDVRCAIAGYLAGTPGRRRARALLVRLGARRLVSGLSRLNEKAGAVPPMAPDSRRRLVELYRRDNEALGELLGRDLSHWNEERQAVASGSRSLQEQPAS